MSTTTTEVSPFQDALAEVADGSTITDHKALEAIITELAQEEKKGLAGYRGMTTVLKRCARLRVSARVIVRKVSGSPDWNAGTDAYRQTVAAAEAHLWADATADEKRRVDGAIRQHITRTFLEPAITDYVLATLPEADKAGVKYADNPDGLTILTGEIPAKVKSAIAAEYKSANLSVPVKFGGTRGGTGGGTEPGDPQNPNAALAVALGALETLAPLQASKDLLRAVSALSSKVMAKDAEVSDRPEVEKYLLRIGIVANGSAKYLAGKASEKDMETVKDSQWVKADS